LALVGFAKSVAQNPSPEQRNWALSPCKCTAAYASNGAVRRSCFTPPAIR
jgi:hypothetical protein